LFIDHLEMSIEVKIPAVGESISSGLVSAWHKQDGEFVNSGDVLLTLETDKVSTEITAEESGVLRIKVQEGEEVKIGEVVAFIEPEEGAPGEKAEKKPEPEKEPEPEEKPSAEPEEKPEPKEKARLEPEKETPVFAPEANLPVQNELLPADEKAEIPVAPKAGGRVTRKKLSPLRRKIAAQLVMAQHNAAILSTFNECDMSAVMALRKKMQENFVEQHGVKLGFMSFFIKATVSALKAVPAINGRMDGDDFIQNHYYDIGVAVGTERGLVVPVVRDADQKSFADIENELGAYAQKAREGKITIDDLTGGVFTISNGGVYGSLLSTPILNPPQSGILGMHAIQQRPVALNGEVVIRPMMYIALSYDHRVVDGKEAVTFLVKVKQNIEEPMRLLLET
jgi:2-oxoglutarate dehydrogenase E2 component (dihydrolipoamide succinyltransferase)